jgi:hypothetical protein
MKLIRLRVFSILVPAVLATAVPIASSLGADSAEAKPTPTACPAGVPATAQCFAGQDSAGAFYLIAQPQGWTGTLVLHAHGGPELGAPSPERTAEDLTRWAIMVKAGYAWAGSTFRQGGVEVRAAAEDTERLRKIFVAHIGKPQRTILHGQSWGASVAAKGAEMFTEQKPYDAVLLTSGVLGGGTRSYDFRLDLRAVYQYLCNNHPRPDEAEYPANIGLPVNSPLKNTDIAARTAECLGLDKPAAQRTPEQQRKVETIEKVIKIPAGSIQSHLNWATFHFRDIVSKRTGGASPFGNSGVRYTGSADDAALNAGVRRYKADPAAVARFGADTDPTGQIPVPVLTLKWIGDPTAFVELDAQFKETMTRGGSADRLVQTFVATGTHSYISDPTYPALTAALLDWVATGTKPTPESIAARCGSAEAQFGAGCTFVPTYVPGALETRVAARDRP